MRYAVKILAGDGSIAAVYTIDARSRAAAEAAAELELGADPGTLSFQTQQYEG